MAASVIAGLEGDAPAVDIEEGVGEAEAELVHANLRGLEGPVGFEPTTPGLKVRSSTAELRAPAD